jgi:hypothetical protein
MNPYTGMQTALGKMPVLHQQILARDIHVFPRLLVAKITAAMRFP